VKHSKLQVKCSALWHDSPSLRSPITEPDASHSSSLHQPTAKTTKVSELVAIRNVSTVKTPVFGNAVPVLGVKVKPG